MSGKSDPTTKKSDREQKLAAALRANLQRRKAARRHAKAEVKADKDTDNG